MKTICRGRERTPRALIALALGLSLIACNPPSTPTPGPDLRLLNWAGFLPDSVLAAYTSETGVSISYEYYDNYDDAADRIGRGEALDVVIIGSDYVPRLIHDDLLAELDYANIPNSRNITASFRDLALDPGNRHSIPWWWGTTGILYRTDLGLPRPTHWADLWRPEYRGHVGLWDLPREGTMVALKALGYSANTGSPRELQEAREYLLRLKPHSVIAPPEAPTMAPFMTQRDVWISYGWAVDLAEAQALGLPVAYVLPEEGSLLWGENLVIPRASRNKTAAEGFIDFLLRAEISAEISLTLAGNLPNEAALALLPPDFLADVAIFPPEQDLRNVEIMLPMDDATNAYVLETWDLFMSGKAYLGLP